ncbi:MAG: dihydrofolate reductase family protein [Pyrinomonadaceae bacterium]
MTSANVYIGTSLDGFIARADGDFGWLMKFADAGAVDSYNEFMAGIDAIVIGRGTFETVLGFPSWPYDKPVFVVSTKMKEMPEELKKKATVLSLEPSDILKHLSEKGFKAAYIDGGKLIQSFLAADLIEDLIIAKVPVLIGRGIPLFGSLNVDLAFDHVRTSTYPNGLVRSYYRRKRET